MEVLVVRLTRLAARSGAAVEVEVEVAVDERSSP